VTSSGTQSGAEEASETMPRKGARPGTSQPVLPVRRWTARRAGPHADVTMADTQPCYAASSLAAGPSPLRQPERRQLTHDHDHEVEYRQRGRQAPPAPSGKPHAEPQPTATGRSPTPAQRLDTTYRQLDRAPAVGEEAGSAGGMSCQLSTDPLGRSRSSPRFEPC
jgi:hypothetical protein